MLDTLRHRALATEDELNGYWPGGAENPDLTIKGWVFCFANYTRFAGRIEKPSANSDAAEADVLAALRDSPERVTLSDGKDQYAHPKSFEALDWIAQRDRRITWLVEQREKVASRAIAKTPGLLDAVGNELTFQTGLMVWVATHEGCGLPFPSRVVPEELPEWIEEINPLDSLRIRQAFMQVNAVRLHALQLQLAARLTAKEKATQQPALWTTFFATRAEETGIGSDVLMRDRSLGSQLAAALVTSDSRRAMSDAASADQAAS